MSSRAAKKEVRRAQWEAKQKSSAKPALYAHPIPGNIVKVPQDLIKLACKLSLTSGSFIDTKFYAYSGRSAAGKVYKPKAIYANSYILRAKSPNYFEPLLQGGYGGYCAKGPLSGDFPSSFPSECEGVGYDSDSDLEDDGEDDASGDRKSKGTSASEESGSSWTHADPSPSHGEKDKDPEEPKDTEPDAKEEGNDDDFFDSVTTGNVRLMRNFAYPTWNAFMYYLYTEDVEFSLLKSQTQKPKSSEAARNEATTVVAPQCSPKSMYRLAHELGLEDLMKRAKDDIRTKLSTDNILTELFSSFTVKYDDIRDMQIEYACQEAKDVVTNGIYEWMQNLSPQDLKRSVGVISSLIQGLGATSTKQGAIRSNGNQLICNSCSGQWRNFRCYNCSNYWNP